MSFGQFSDVLNLRYVEEAGAVDAIAQGERRRQKSGKNTCQHGGGGGQEAPVTQQEPGYRV